VVEQVRAFLVSEDFKSLLARAAQLAVPTAWGVVAGALSFVLALTVIVLVLVYLVFLLIDYRLFARTWKDYLPPTYKEAILDFLGEFQVAMRRYFRGQFIVAAITGVFFAIGFKIIDLPLGILLGLLIGILNMVPYLQTVAFVPACLLGVFRAVEHQSSILASVLMVVAVFGCVQLTMDGFLSPRILGASVGLRPVIIMLSVFVWGRLLGFFGLVLAIPLSCLGLAYYRRIVLKKKMPARGAGSAG
jgi:predicted PurR-regulated permease PerM